MEKYIVPGISAINQKIESDLDIIKNELLKVCGNNLVSIILCGGFGRGEGTVIYDGQKFLPFNDYDLLLITKRRISRHILNKTSKSLARRLDIRFVDLGAIKHTNLDYLPQTIFSYDLRQSKLIYGIKTVWDKIPKFSSDTIPLDEAKLLLFNRIICFLELTPDNFLNRKHLSDLEHRKLVLQLSKPVIASAIAYLVKEKKYDSSYQKQLKNFLNLGLPADVNDLVSRSYNLKLSLEDPLLVDPWKYWMNARNFYIQTFEHFVKGKQQSWLEFYENHKKFEKNFITTLKEAVKFILYLDRPVDQNKKRLAEIKSLSTILSVNKDFSTNINWDEEKKICVELWSHYHH